MCINGKVFERDTEEDNMEDFKGTRLGGIEKSGVGSKGVGA